MAFAVGSPHSIGPGAVHASLLLAGVALQRVRVTGELDGGAGHPVEQHVGQDLSCELEHALQVWLGGAGGELHLALGEQHRDLLLVAVEWVLVQRDLVGVEEREGAVFEAEEVIADVLGEGVDVALGHVAAVAGCGLSPQRA